MSGQASAMTAASPRRAVVAASALLGLFVARPLLNRAGDLTIALLVLFVTLLAVGVSWPVAAEPRAGWAVTAAVLALGIGAFALGRLSGGGHPPAPFTWRVAAMVTLAAVAEEAFFRRLLYAVLRPGGVLLAVLGSAALFAVAHVTVYGWWVLPIDVAAGLVLCWQRWASGTWRARRHAHRRQPPDDPVRCWARSPAWPCWPAPSWPAVQHHAARARLPFGRHHVPHLRRARVQGTEEKRGALMAAEWANSHGGVNGHRLVVETRRLTGPRRAGGDGRIAAGRDVGGGWQPWQRLLGGGGRGGHPPGPNAVGDRGRRSTPTVVCRRVELHPHVAHGRQPGATRSTSSATRGQAATPHAGALRWAVAYVDDPYGRAVADGAKAEVAATGQPLVGTFPYTLATADFETLAAQIAATHPDVLYVSAYLDDGMALRQALVQQHVPLVANLGTSSSYCMPAFGQALGASGVGVFASDKPDAAAVRTDALSPEGRATLAWAAPLYLARYHEPMWSHALSGFANAFALFVHVLPLAGRADAAAVASTALTVKLPVGTLANGGGLDIAPLNAPDAGNNRGAAGVIWEWVGPGQRAVVWPPAFATHPVVALPLAT